MLFSDVFRDYEADYSGTMSAEEVEEEEEEEGKELPLICCMPPLLNWLQFASSLKSRYIKSFFFFFALEKSLAWLLFFHFRSKSMQLKYKKCSSVLVGQ